MSEKGLILQSFTKIEDNYPYVYLIGKTITKKTFLIKKLYFPFFFIKLEKDFLKRSKEINDEFVKYLKKHNSQINELFKILNDHIESNASNRQYFIDATKDKFQDFFKDIYCIHIIDKIKSHKELCESNINSLNKLKIELNNELVNNIKLKEYENVKIEDMKKIISSTLNSISFLLEDSKLIDYSKTQMKKVSHIEPIKNEILYRLFDGIEKTETDISLPNKFLIENDIKSQLEIEDKPVSKNQIETIWNKFNYYNKSEFQKIDLHYMNPKVKSCNDQDFTKVIKTLSIDIETLRTEEIISVSFYSNEYSGVIFNAKHPNIKKKHKFDIIKVTSEEDLLKLFIEKLHELDPDIITGWSFVDFDLNIIHKRCKLNKVEFNLGRIPLLTRMIVSENFLKDSTCTIPGRVVLDGIAVLKSNFVKYDDYKLNTVATAMLGEQKIATGVDVWDFYESDHDTLLEYNLHDSKLVYEIIVEKGYIDISIARSLITGMSMDKLDKSIQTLDYLYLLKARERGYVVPDNLGFTKERQIEGAYVRDPKTGIYNNILVFDFKSLYPSIMISLNIDKQSYLGNVEHHKEYEVFDLDRFFDPKKHEDVIVSPTGAVFSKEEAIIPDILEELWRQRDIAKKEKNDVKSYAIKITMNSMYGSMASPFSRFFSLDIAGSITAFSRTMIKKTAQILIDQGYDVIYGDTDSIFVHGNFKTLKECIEFGKKKEEEINKFLSNLIKSKFDRKSKIELEFEKVYKKFIMPQIRGKETGAKKRYAGLKIDIKTKKEKLDVVGLEAVRRDWTIAAKNYQLKMLDIIFSNDDPKKEMIEFTKKTIKNLESGKLDKELIYKKGLRKGLDTYTKTTPPHVKAARMLDKIENDVIEYYITEDGPQPLQKLKSKIDYNHYIEKQIKPIANSLFSFFNLKFDDVLKGSKQASLFDF